MRTLLLAAVAASLLAQMPEPLTSDAAGVYAIWPGTPPGSERWTWREQNGTRNGNRMVRNVVTPTLTMYKPAAGKANGASVIIAPGGAWRFLMVDHEGVDMARWLAERGITAFVLRYRLMHTPEAEAEMNQYLQDLGKRLNAADVRSEEPRIWDELTQAAMKMAGEDGRQAIRFVRQHAADWGLDPHRIGIAGFSAGGSVVMETVMEHDEASRPDFAAPVYAAYRNARPVPDDAPPLFIVITDDDKLISPHSSAQLYTAWHSAGFPAELHVFRRGNHGFGMKRQNSPSDRWIELFHGWLENSGILNGDAVGRMYVFGDSYSDTGAGYLDGNGPTAVAYLAKRLGLRLALPNEPDAGSQSLNFAVSGAQTGRGAGRRVKNALLGRGMADQIDDFTGRVQSKAITFDPQRTLFFLAGGLNDRKLPTEQTVSNLKEQIRKLYGAGARRFRLALLPTAIPEFSEVGLRLNPALERIPAELAGSLAGADIRLSLWGAYFDEVMRSPSAFRIRNTKDACAGRALFDQNSAPCANPEAFYYYHAGHPSTAVHRIVGGKLAEELQSPR